MLKTPESSVDDLEAACRRTETGAPSDAVVWRIWGAGPPLVLLHGGYGSWTHWVRNIDFFAETRTVIVPDMPGFQLSRDLPQPPSMEALVERLSSGLDTILDAEQRFDLVGFSFGTSVGGLLAHAQARRVGRYVLVGGGRGLGAKPTERPRLLKWREFPDQAARDEAHRHNLAAFMIADPARIGDHAIQIQARNAEGGRLRSRGLVKSDAVVRALREAHVKLGAIWGEADVGGPEGLAERLAILRTADPDCPYGVIEGAGHWVQYEASEAFNPMLDEMLSSEDRV